MGTGLRPGAKAPDQPPTPYRLRASPRLYSFIVHWSLERHARLRVPERAARQLRQQRPASAAQRPGLADPLPGRTVALRRRRSGVPVHHRPTDGGPHADVHGTAVREADRRRRTAEERQAPTDAADRHLQRRPALERSDGVARADRHRPEHHARGLPAVPTVLLAGSRPGTEHRPAARQPGLGAGSRWERAPRRVRQQRPTG